MSNGIRKGWGAILLATIIWSQALWADAPPGPPERPLWEVGVFTGAARIPHYRGSDEYSLYVIPVPYLIYRGEFIRANRDGVKGIFWSSDRVESALSLNGNPPPKKNNTARQGMPKLGAMMEAGPALRISLTPPETPNPVLVIAGIRGAMSVDTDDYGMAYEGIRGGVNLVYRNRTLLAAQQISWGLVAGVDFADRSYHRYFYEVKPRYATGDRPAYTPSGGYSGFSMSVNMTKKISDRLSIGAYYRWDNLSGAAYADSPLVKTENNHIVGCAAVLNLFRSKKTSVYQSE